MASQILPVVSGALTELPADTPRPGKGLKSWVAIVRKDPTAPGGIAREFWPRARGSVFYHVSKKMVADERFYALEFGSDKVLGNSGRERHRQYFVGIVFCGKELHLAPCLDIESAISSAAAANTIADENPKSMQTIRGAVFERNPTKPPEPTSTPAEAPEEAGIGDDDMDTSDLLGMLTGLESAITEEDWAGAEYLAGRIASGAKTKKLAAAAKARRESIEREREWEANSAVKGGE